MNKAVLLDRDGTIMRDVHYCRRVEDVELLPKAGEGLRLLSDSGFTLAIVTNQSGLARGYFTEATLNRIHQAMREKLMTFGVRIDAIYYCPHHPDAGCECRKPKPKLAYQAINDLNINVSQSFIIGDRLMDIELARAIGCKGIMINGEYTETELKAAKIVPDYIATDMEAAARWIIKESHLSGVAR